MSYINNVEEKIVVRNFKELIVWQKSFDLSLRMYKLCEKFPGEEKYRLKDQILRATTSIAANIAEGNGQLYPKKTINFVNNAIGSASEVRHWLELSKSLNYISCDEFEELDSLTEEIIKMSIGYIKKINREL